jgi:hypothetical protein
VGGAAGLGRGLAVGSPRGVSSSRFVGVLPLFTTNTAKAIMIKLATILMKIPDEGHGPGDFGGIQDYSGRQSHFNVG